MGKKSNKKEVAQKIKQMEKEVMERGLVDDSSSLEDHKAALTSILGDENFQVSASESTKRDNPLILLIDDDPQFRGMAKQALEFAGYDIVEAADGNEGLKCQFKKPADLIISDIIMPEKEGIETVMEIRDKFPAAKIIVISGGGWYGTEIDFDMAEKLGALTLNKPFEINDLLGAVKQMLAKPKPKSRT